MIARRRPAVHGRAAMRKLFEAIVAGVKPELVSQVDELEIKGDWAWTVAKFVITYTPTDGAAPTKDFGRSILIYEKGRDRRWRIARDIDTPSPDGESVPTTGSKP